MHKTFISVLLAASLASGMAASKERARDLGVEFDGTAGKLNAITDVAGVEVGHVTLIEGEGRTSVGQGPVRTGVTVVLPRGHASSKPVNGGFFNLNGYGEMTGQSYLQDLGLVYGPIGISNTNAIGQVYAGIQRWSAQKFGEAVTPVVGETWDGGINDIQGFHVKPEHAMEAIDRANGGPVAEGNVGGGTGMRCFGFKGGIGTASRTISIGKKPYIVGVLVQCNTGAREVLRISGVPVGHELNAKWLPCYAPGQSDEKKKPECQADGSGGKSVPDDGSIIVVVATDVPLSSIELNRVARRASLGLGRLGSFSGNGSGDLIVSFSTTSAANDVPDEQLNEGPMLATGKLDPVFQATVEATEEAIVNALVAADTMTGADGYTLFGLPHDELKQLIGLYGRQQAK
ncbi:DmpA family aminopeptidase [Phyllobacterium calauticae]|uniref:DmpA family aminopeptidase n=1 Tax=Phyllobacterium calauticae TaxID=2817027 RepID=UPI001CC136B8|nr:P1 family peptidase [Phyllobacterium calauticae]